MSIVFKPKKNYTVVTSSYFDDIKLIKQSLSETFKDIHKNTKEYPGFDFNDLQLRSTVEILILANQGAREVSDFFRNLKDNQLSKYKSDYGPWRDCDEEWSKVDPDYVPFGDKPL
ncbi:MAG: hypothetical protein HUJ68_10040 [Clostridia bacterium]|nr:hypothetical protein [Clostridia bacterium]